MKAPSESDRRRSTRIVQAVPITVTAVDALGQPFREHTTTMMVNCHGCKYSSKHYVPMNSVVRLEVPRPQPGPLPPTTQARVVWVKRPSTVRELFQIGVEFEIAGNIWGISFPPEDWFAYPNDIEKAKKIVIEQGPDDLGDGLEYVDEEVEQIEEIEDIKDNPRNVRIPAPPVRSPTKAAVSSGAEPRYDVALSFAGEDRKYVEQTAKALKRRGIKTFYDRYEVAELWGKDLYTHLDYIYRQRSNYTVMFISKHYATKLWTNHERKSAQARAFEESKEYILPARFDDTEVPGLLPTVGYVDLRNTTPTQLAELISRKLRLS
jgi:hypothetical protein